MPINNRRMSEPLGSKLLAFVAVASVTVASAVVSAPGAGADEPDHSAVMWENRGQDELGGSGLDVDGDRKVVVVAGGVSDASVGSQWFVRGIDRATGATRWEDRFGPMSFGLAKDVAVEGGRAFVAGWILRPGDGFVFVVRAYDLARGSVLWSQEIARGPSCVEEAQGFARCVAKAIAVHGGRVYVVGHLSRGDTRSDVAVLAFDASTGALEWESVTDPRGAGENDHAWTVAVSGRSVIVTGEIENESALIVRSYEAATGALRWQRVLPGALNYTLKDTLAVNDNTAVVAGSDSAGDFFVSAFDLRSGSPLWTDNVDEGDRIGQATSLAIDGGTVFASGIVGCNPDSFVECKLAVRAYDTRNGRLRWQRSEVARGGDWYAERMTAGGGRVFVTGLELLDDGGYHPVLSAYDGRNGALVGSELFAPGGVVAPQSGFAGFAGGLVFLHGRLVVAGESFTSAAGTSDLIVRQ